MSLTKVNYIDDETVIYAQNLNDIQDEIINSEILSGSAPPATTTVGVVGQLYVDKTAKRIYRCDNISEGVYTWNLYGGADYYSKPDTGIPKNDLAESVQESLEKADSALQEHQDISGKQDKTDSSLSTTAKTVVGSINELNTNKQDKSNLRTSFQTTPDHTHYPSEKLVKDSLDAQSSQISALETFLKAVLPAEYSTSTTYAVGAICIHANKLYQATQATSGAWNSAHWTQVRINNVSVLSYTEV